MAVSFLTQLVVVLFGMCVAQYGDPRPMMESIVEGLRASSPQENLPTFAALFGDGSDAAKTAEGIEITQANRVVSMTEETGEDKGTDAGQRGEDGGVGGGFVAFGIVLIFFEPCFEILV